MARPSVLRRDPFGISLAIATRPRHLAWLERQFPGVDFDPIVSAHEGAHVAQFMLDHIGEQQTKEVHAYLTDWAAGHIWDALHAP